MSDFKEDYFGDLMDFCIKFAEESEVEQERIGFHLSRVLAKSHLNCFKDSAQAQKYLNISVEDGWCFSLKEYLRGEDE